MSGLAYQGGVPKVLVKYHKSFENQILIMDQQHFWNTT